MNFSPAVNFDIVPSLLHFGSSMPLEKGRNCPDRSAITKSTRVVFTDRCFPTLPPSEFLFFLRVRGNQLDMSQVAEGAPP